jgi:hypothetical protein
MRFVPFLLLWYLALAPAPAAAQADTLVGTLQTLDLQQRQLRVLVGIGMALRAERVRVPAHLSLTTDSVALPLTALRPGDVVRIVGGVQRGDRVAYSIERLVAAGKTP